MLLPSPRNTGKPKSVLRITTLSSLSARVFFCGSFIWFFKLEPGDQMPFCRTAGALAATWKAPPLASVWK